MAQVWRAWKRRGALGLALLASLPFVAASGWAQDPLSERELAWHVLNRLGYGPRPGDLEAVLELGVDAYVSKQLSAAEPLPPELGIKLDSLETLRLSPRELAKRFPIEKKAQDKDKAKDKPKQKKDRGGNDDKKRLVSELGMAKLLRAVYSENQLEEVMTDFWFNHFNVDARKGKVMPYMLGEHEKILREHALGRFEDLLIASAQSPAMLFYLDNWLSIDPKSHMRQEEPRRGKRKSRGKDNPRIPKQAKGLNENYARELLELHTLGVDGGYTQKDVQEVARCFTGWSLRKPQSGSAFDFREDLHDPGSKQVLGLKVGPHQGMAEGIQVLRFLARQPATARFISRKLALRFVSDHPSEALIERMAQRFLETDGQIREVLRVLFESPEFRSREAFQAKVKTPLEFVVSALRATGVRLEPGDGRVFKVLQELGQPLYQCQPPTGYPEASASWVNSGDLMGRMQFATRLAGELSQTPPGEGMRELARNVLGFEASPQTIEVLERQAPGPKGAVALLVGGPDFQKQ